MLIIEAKGQRQPCNKYHYKPLSSPRALTRPPIIKLRRTTSCSLQQGETLHTSAIDICDLKHAA